MSVLYIGPYRQTDTNGQVARYFLNGLIDEYDKHYVISRPAYFETDYGVLSKNIEFFTEKNTTNQKKHCVLVQHMPISHMQYMPDIADHHYAFPILDNTCDFGLMKSDLRILSYFQKIFVQSDIEAKTLALNYPDISDKIVKFHPKINHKQYKKICEKKYSFKNYPNNKKLYFIGNMDNDEGSIKKIIFALYSTTLKYCVSPICVFYLDYHNTPDIKTLDNNIRQMREDFGMPSNLSKEIFIFKHFSEEDLIIAHHSCDIYLSINENQTQYLHESYAKISGNKIISLDDIYDTSIPHRTKDIPYNYELKKRYASVSKLIEALKTTL